MQTYVHQVFKINYNGHYVIDRRSTSRYQRQKCVYAAPNKTTEAEGERYTHINIQRDYSSSPPESPCGYRCVPDVSWGQTTMKVAYIR